MAPVQEGWAMAKDVKVVSPLDIPMLLSKP
jgi:hypothetical protein